MAAKDYKDLIVWQKANALWENVFAQLGQGPHPETHPFCWIINTTRTYARRLPDCICSAAQAKDIKEKHLWVMRGWATIKNFEIQIQDSKSSEFTSDEDIAERLKAADEIATLLKGLQDALEIQMVKS